MSLPPVTLEGYCWNCVWSLEIENFHWQHIFPSIKLIFRKNCHSLVDQRSQWKQRPQSIIIIAHRWKSSLSANGNGNKTKNFTTKIPSEKLLQCLALWILSKRNDFSYCRLLAITPAKFCREAARITCQNFNRDWLRKEKKVVPYTVHLSYIMTFWEPNVAGVYFPGQIVLLHIQLCSSPKQMTDLQSNSSNLLSKPVFKSV